MLQKQSQTGGPGRVLFCALAAGFLFLSTHAGALSAEVSYDATLTGQIGEVARPESIWIGAIEVRLRSPFVFEDMREEALVFMRALAPRGRDVECRLTGERTSGPDVGTLFGDCFVLDPSDGQDINLGASLIEKGYARPCDEDIAVIAIWPPVFACQ